MQRSNNVNRFGLTLLAMAALLYAGTWHAAAQGSWATVAPIPTAREWFGAATGPNDLIYAIGGEYDYRGSGGSYGSLTSVEAYNPATNTWAEAAPILTVQMDLAAATGPDGRLYAMGGFSDFSDTPANTVEAYDPTSDTWSVMAPMLTARGALAAATGPDGHIYTIGGLANLEALSAVEAYDMSTNTWSSVASMPTARWGLAAATGPDGKIYAIGGQNISNAFNTVEAYDPSTNTWTTVAPLPNALTEIAAATGPDGRIYVFGGGNSSAPVVNTVEAYDTSTNTWTTVASMPTARRALGAATGPDGRIYAISGTIFVTGGGTDTNAVDAYTSIAVSKLTISPNTVPGSLKAIGTVTLSAPVAIPQLVTLINTNPAASVPAYVLIPAGAKSAPFTVTTTAVTTTQTGTVTASYGGISKSATLKVRPIGVKSVSIVPNPILGGYNTIGIVTLEAPAAPGDITVTLASSNLSVASPDATVTIPAGEINGCFNINTTAVSATTYVTISATANGIKKSKTLKVMP